MSNKRRLPATDMEAAGEDQGASRARREDSSTSGAEQVTVGDMAVNCRSPGATRRAVDGRRPTVEAFFHREGCCLNLLGGGHGFVT